MHTSELGNKGAACEIFSENLRSIHVGQFQLLPPQISMGPWWYWGGMTPTPDSVLFPHSHCQGFSESGSAFFLLLDPCLFHFNPTILSVHHSLSLLFTLHGTLLLSLQRCHAIQTFTEMIPLSERTFCITQTKQTSITTFYLPHFLKLASS